MLDAEERAMTIMRRLLLVEHELADAVNLNGLLSQQNDVLKQELHELQRAAEREAILYSNVAPLPPNVRVDRHREAPSPAERMSPVSASGADTGHAPTVNLQV